MDLLYFAHLAANLVTNCPPDHLPVLDYGQYIDCTDRPCPMFSYCNREDESPICCSNSNEESAALSANAVTETFESIHNSLSANNVKYVNDTGDPICPIELIGYDCSPEQMDVCVGSTCVYSWKKSKWACCKETQNRKSKGTKKLNRHFPH